MKKKIVIDKRDFSLYFLRVREKQRVITYQHLTRAISFGADSMASLKRYLYTLNLFRSPSGAEPESEHQQQTNVLATRVYIILLFVILTALTLATTLLESRISITIENPTQTQFELLSDATCLCSYISPVYGEFVSIESSFHQVCSSDFITDRWISSFYFGTNSTYFLPTDIRLTGPALFQALASFCRLSQANVNQSLLLLSSTSLMSSFVISESVLGLKVQAFLDQFRLTTLNTLTMNIQLISSIIMRNKIINGLGTGIYLAGYPGLMAAVPNTYVNEDEILCDCSRNLTCFGPLGIYEQFNVITDGINDFMATMIIPGLSSGCIQVDACLHSSLECFFNQTCVNTIVPYVKTSNANFTAMSPLRLSRFYLNSTIDSIVDELMVEEWKPNVSYDKYYAACAPVSCTYLSDTRHHFLYVINTIIGLLGGLCTGLGIVVPLIVGFIRRPKTNAVNPVPRVPCEYL